MPNRLANELSPYLIQHANNPVDWYPWGQEALDRARNEDKPIFLSVGYSACHWCHVMEHESFEDEEIARRLNEHFVPVKVDREERPDLDQIYMHAVQAMTGRGGWPMSVFLTPELKPFFGGTYWPPQARMGMPGFQQVLEAVADAWQHRRQQAIDQAEQLTEHLRQATAPGTAEMALPDELLKNGVANLERSFDFTHGGFGGAPKFPHAVDLQLLLRAWHRWPREGILQMVRLNLDKMARGGIYDHLGGGFARYSVDERWLVPHFEKMLYDNALLAGVYLDAYLVTRDPEYDRVAQETLDYVLRDMTDPRGGFHSAEDADSEGVEGKFYVWSPEEVHEVLGDEAGTRFCEVYDVTAHGNFEGKSILNLAQSIDQCASAKGWDAQQLRAELAASRAKLLEARQRRVRPARDDKVLVSWNGLMIDALAKAAGALASDRYLQAAIAAAEFIQNQVVDQDGRLLHCWRDGRARHHAYLDDYACLTNSLVSLYEASLEERWIDEAVSLADAMLKRFRDVEQGGFYFTANDHESLILRSKEFQDGSVPSANSMAATALIRLGSLCGRADYQHAGQEILDQATGLMKQHPTAAGQMLNALDMQLGPLSEIVVIGDPSEPDTAEVIKDLRSRYIPNRVFACRAHADAPDGSVELDPIFVGREPSERPPTVYVCQKFVCGAPSRGKDAARMVWDRLANPGSAPS
jgi:uncharacterized protein YyaL (SSP411 family)